jgi:hypothetical protein
MRPPPPAIASTVPAINPALKNNDISDNVSCKTLPQFYYLFSMKFMIFISQIPSHNNNNKE